MILALHSSVLPALRGKIKASDAMLFISFLLSDVLCNKETRYTAHGQLKRVCRFAGTSFPARKALMFGRRCAGVARAQ